MWREGAAGLRASVTAVNSCDARTVAGASCFWACMGGNDAAAAAGGVFFWTCTLAGVAGLWTSTCAVACFSTTAAAANAHNLCT